MSYTCTLGARRHVFRDLKTLLAKASPARSGDMLAGLAAGSEDERMAARMALSELPLERFLHEAVVPYEEDEVTRLIIDGHDAGAFAPVAGLSVGEFRDWLLSDAADTASLAALAPGLTPEMVAAVSKLMRNQDLILAAAKCQVVTRFRNTLGLPGRLAVRLQPNHPTDDPRGIAAAMLDGLLYGAGDAVIGINPASDSLPAIAALLRLVDDFRMQYEVPTQSCVLTHVTNTLRAMDAGAPVDLVFQSIGGTEAVNRSFGVSAALLDEADSAARSLRRGSVGSNVMYFETGQGSALSANAHHGVDQQTLEARAYGLARRYRPLLVNTVVGFIGPEYLYDGKQIIRAGLEDHFCGKLLGLPMGCDICYTNHAEADQDDMDTLLTLLGVAGINFIMGVPGADDIMLNYQSTSFHDALYLRKLLGRRRAPEFEDWLERMGIADFNGQLIFAQNGSSIGGDPNQRAVVDGLRLGWLEESENLILQHYGIKGDAKGQQARETAARQRELNEAGLVAAKDLREAQERLWTRHGRRVPMLVKVAPDLADEVRNTVGLVEDAGTHVQRLGRDLEGTGDLLQDQADAEGDQQRVQWSVVHVLDEGHLQQHADEPADEESDDQRGDQSNPGVGDEVLLHRVGGVRAGHDEGPVRHVDDAHLSESQGQAECGEQQDRAEAQSGEELGDDYVHDRSRFLVCCAGRSVARAGLLRE